MNAAIPLFCMQLLHNDEPVGVVDGGAVDVDQDVPGGEARFWLGLRGLRGSPTCALPPRKPEDPAPQA